MQDAGRAGGSSALLGEGVAAERLTGVELLARARCGRPPLRVAGASIEQGDAETPGATRTAAARW